jgi:hypothetical protein
MHGPVRDLLNIFGSAQFDWRLSVPLSARPNSSDDPTPLKFTVAVGGVKLPSGHPWLVSTGSKSITSLPPALN